MCVCLYPSLLSIRTCWPVCVAAMLAMYFNRVCVFAGVQSHFDVFRAAGRLAVKSIEPVAERLLV